MSFPSLAPTASPPSMVFLGDHEMLHFWYAIYNDEDTWNDWVEAVLDSANNASASQIEAVNKFSPYLFKAMLEPT